MKNFLKRSYDVGEESTDDTRVGYGQLNDSPSQPEQSGPHSPGTPPPIRLTMVQIQTESKLRRQLFSELSSFLSKKQATSPSEDKKPVAPPRTIAPDATDSKPSKIILVEEEEGSTLIKKMYRVPFHFRVAMLIWYIYWLSSQINYINMEADQIKHNAVVICNSSESSVNLVLGMSHTVAVEANVKANLEIQQFVNTTSEMVVDADLYSEEFSGAAQSVDLEFTDPVFGTTTEIALWEMAAIDAWNEAFDKTQSAVASLANIQLSQKILYVDNFADQLLDKLDPTQYGIQQDLQEYLSDIAPTLNIEAPPKQNVSYCKDINWKEFDSAVDFIKIGIYIALVLISLLLMTIVSTKWIWIYKKTQITTSSRESSSQESSQITRIVRYFVKDKARLITAFIGIFGLMQIGVEFYLMGYVRNQLQDFTNNEIRPTALRAASQWNKAEAKIWEPYVNGTNSYIMTVQGNSQSYLSQLQYYVNNQTSFLQQSKETTQTVILDNLGKDFGNIVIKVIQCATPLYMLDDFINEVIDYIASRKINLPTLASPTMFQVNKDAVNSHVDLMNTQIEKFVDWYSESIRKHIPFYAFLAIYGSGVFLYDLAEFLYFKYKQHRNTELPLH